MSMNPIADVNSVYIEEVLKPQIAPKLKSASKPASDLDGDGDVDSFEKKVRQFIYDVRHLMRKNNIPAEKAFQVRASKTNYGGDVIKAAKEKMGIKVGGTPVAEETEGGERLYKIIIRYKNGTTYRKRTSQSEINRLRSNPNVSSVEKTEYAQELDYADKKPKKLDPVGKEDSKGDVDNDGIPASRDKNDRYLLKRREAVGKAIRQRRTHGLKESFSNWRQDLCEVIDDDISSKKKNEVKEMPKNKKNKVVICPTMNENVHLIESVELTEDYLNETINIATEFFYNCGLNENGIDIVIEELGEEKFAEFVFNLAEDYFLSEARTLTGKKKSPATGKQLGISRKAAPGKTTQAAVEKHGTTRTLSSGSPSATIKKNIGKKITANKAKEAVEKAKETQTPSPEPRKKSVKDRVAGFILRGIERDRAARATASDLAGKTAQTLKKAASVGSKAASEFGKGFSSGVRGTATVAQKTKKAVVGEEYIEEKAESEQQQKLFGLALSVKRGETPRSEASAEVLKIVDSMSEKKIRDFAKTKHAGIPKKVEEAIAPVTQVTQTQKKTQDMQQNQSQEKLQQQKQQKKVAQQRDRQRQQEIQILNRKLQALRSAPRGVDTDITAGYEPKGEVIDELRASEIRGFGSPEKRQGPYLVGARQGRIERGEKGGRHYWSGGQGGSRTERGKSKGEEGSQESRLNPPEETGRNLQRQAIKRGSKMSSRLD